MITNKKEMNKKMMIKKMKKTKMVTVMKCSIVQGGAGIVRNCAVTTDTNDAERVGSRQQRGY
jgi:hypothetical protein